MSNWVSRNHYFDDYEDGTEPAWADRMRRIESQGWATYAIGVDRIEYRKRNWICTVWMKPDYWQFERMTQ